MIDMGSTAAAGTVVGVAWLADMDFSSGMVRVTTAPVNLTVGGQQYQGLGIFGGVSDLAEGPDSAARQLTLSLSVVNTAMIATVRGNVEGYRGRTVALSLQLFDATFQPVGPAVLRWRGVMNKVQITRRPAAADGSSPATGSIEMVCSRSGMARARHAQGARLTDAQQRVRYPGDTGLRYVRTLIEKPTPWLSKAFQQV